MAGLQVGVTAGRRGGELVDALTRLGARVVWAPTVEIVPAPAGTVRRQTEVALDARPAWIVVATAEALNRWVDGARGAQPDVLGLLTAGKVAARGAKATGACRQHGVATVLTAPTERGVDLARLVVDLAAAGDHVAVVVDGSGSPGVVAELESAALAVHVVAPYRWVVPAAAGPTPDPGRSVPAAELLRALRSGARRHDLHEPAGGGGALRRGRLARDGDGGSRRPDRFGGPARAGRGHRPGNRRSARAARGSACPCARCNPASPPWPARSPLRRSASGRSADRSH